MTEKSFYVKGREESEEYIESEKPALNQLIAMGYEYKSQQELNIERKDFRQVLLYDRLERAIRKLNPELDEDGVYDALNQIKEDSFPTYLDIMDSNEQIRAKLVGLSRSGGLNPITVVQNFGDGNIDKTVKIFDFDNPENNDFLVTNQFQLNGLKESIYPDIVVFSNGIPLVIIECKSPYIKKPIHEAVEKNFGKYQSRGYGYERLMFYNHFLVATCGIEARHGSIGAGVNNYARWSEAYPLSLEDIKKICKGEPREQEILIAGMLDKKHLIDLLKNYVSYEVSENKKIKKMAKHQQYRVVTKAIDKLKMDHKENIITDKGGVIWHTQGSGKSLSMLWLATQLMYKFANPPILIVTDRKQLDKQIEETFKSCGFSTPKRTTTSKDLEKELKNPKGKTIMTTIQKFGTADNHIHTKEKVIVLIDEGHRTQYKFNAEAMRSAIPNGVFFAFTGTPIDKKNKSTYKVFGPLLDRYSFKESKADGSTLPIYYEGRLPELFIADEDESLENIFDRVFSHLTRDVKDKLKKQYVNRQSINEAPERIRKICIDIIEHFTKSIQPNGSKAMIVTVSKDAAVTYKRELDKLKGPISKIIMTHHLGEKGKKDDTVWDQYFLTDEQKEKETTLFKKPEDPTQILIVVDMLLVGYDAPILQVLYLDKTLKEHSLLQAIARVNRPYNAGKQHGLIVDYCGITNELQKALSIFDDQDIVGVLIPFENEVSTLRQRHKEAMSFFSDMKDREDNNEIILKFAPVNIRNDFEYSFKMLSKAMDAVLPRKEAEPYIDDFKFLAKKRQMLRTKYGGDEFSLKEDGRKVQQLIDDYLQSLKISQLMEIREVTDETFLSDMAKITDNNKKAQTALIRNKVSQIISAKAHENPSYYEKMKERLDTLINEEKEKRKEDAVYFNGYKKILEDLYNEKKEREKLGLSNTFEFAIYEEILSITKDKEISKTFTKKISEGIERETDLVGWKTKTSSQQRIGEKIYDILSEIPNKLLEDDIEKKNELTDRFVDLAKINIKS